ncbi:uncharacterized protein PAF06_015171 [Gastrophryne carolinensis]
MMAAALAQKLCEAVENEDTREVDNLLNLGADPNLVLPNGIAAIHLASGKENESALRCLALILQNGGDPNVRSIEELTPVHVASSWGCCKALICLLRKGGDPSIQDQDGNTALDLALLENNRRCVVALQEYERTEEAFPDQMQGYLKSDDSLPNDFTDMSSITLLLESNYEMSAFCSTKYSPFISVPKNAKAAKGGDDAVLTSPIEQIESKIKLENNQYREDAGLHCPKLPPNTDGIITNNCSHLKVEDSSVVCAAWASETSHGIKEYSSCWHTNGTIDNNIPTEIHEPSAESTNIYSLDKNQTVETGALIADPNRRNVEVDEIIRERARLMLNFSNTLTQVETLKNWEGLDVTSPDHVYTYNRGHSNDDLEKTLVLSGHINLPGCEGLEDQGETSGSKYTSCSSEGFTTLVENTFSSRQEGPISYCKSLDNINPTEAGNPSSEIGVLRSLNVSNVSEQDSGSGIVHTLQPSEENHDDKVCSRPSAQLPNTYSVLADNHEMNTLRNTETLCQSPSLTLPVDATDAHESGPQGLTVRLRNLMLSTKNCRSPVLCSESGDGSFSSDTLPITKAIIPTGREQTICPEIRDSGITRSNNSADTFVLKTSETKLEEFSLDLHEELKKMMLATKVSHPSPVLKEERNQCFFTPRAKSRLLSFKSRHSNNSLFDESVEMPQRGRRVRSPDGESPVLSDTAKCKESISSSDRRVRGDSVCTVQPVISAGGKDPESDSSVSISNFLTDDLSSSETEAKCRLMLKNPSKAPCVEGRMSESVWLTEETESSGEADHKFAVAGSDGFKEDSPALLQNGSLLHSTLLEDAAVNSLKGPRYSFSRLSCVPKANGTDIKPCQPTSNPNSQEVPLSPGGRPINVSHCEPVEYLYTDNEEGHSLIERHLPCSNLYSSNISDLSDDTILYDWRNYRSCKQIINKDSPACTPNRVAVELYRLSNNEIARRLRELGEDPGQVTSKTRRVCIFLLDKLIKEQATKDPGGLSFDYSPELSLALRTYDIPDCNTDEATLSREFDQPDKAKKWREGVLKSSFNYLLLDPRVTQNLPSLAHTMSRPDCFRTFVHAVFYVGKGKRARPYCHLYEALAHYKGKNKPPCSKIQHIVDIWKSGQGVLSLHCFQNTIPVEAYTREACMVDAIGLKMLTNQKKGVYYGQAQNWTPTRRRRLGVHMLHRAMQIFLAEGERQLRPPDISAGE